MLFEFDTENSTVAAGALLVYATYKSRDPKRGPSGYDLWEQIERFARRAAKRADDVSDFLAKFKPMMGCGTLNPRWCSTGTMATNAEYFENGEIIVKGESDTKRRDFMISITESPQEEQQKVVDCIYDQTQRIILLVRDRLEREKPFETNFAEEK
jgi:hypothetical protein